MMRRLMVSLALACASLAHGEEYTIHAGDTLWQIHRQLGHSVEDLYQMNPWLQGVGEKEKLEAGKKITWVSFQDLADYLKNEHKPQRDLPKERGSLLLYVRYSPPDEHDTGVFYWEVLFYAREQRDRMMAEMRLPQLRLALPVFVEKVNTKQRP